MLPYGETVTRHRGQKVDDGYGGTVIDWSAPTADLTIVGVALAPRIEDEVGGAGRTGTIDGYTMYAPFGIDITFEDRVTTPYGLFEVEGEPGHWRQPHTGWGAVATILLRRVIG